MMSSLSRETDDPSHPADEVDHRDSPSNIPPKAPLSSDLASSWKMKGRTMSQHHLVRASSSQSPLVPAQLLLQHPCLLSATSHQPEKVPLLVREDTSASQKPVSATTTQSALPVSPGSDTVEVWNVVTQSDDGDEEEDYQESNYQYGDQQIEEDDDRPLHFYAMADPTLPPEQDCTDPDTSFWAMMETYASEAMVMPSSSPPPLDPTEPARTRRHDARLWWMSQLSSPSTTAPLQDHKAEVLQLLEESMISTPSTPESLPSIPEETGSHDVTAHPLHQHPSNALTTPGLLLKHWQGEMATPHQPVRRHRLPKGHDKENDQHLISNQHADHQMEGEEPFPISKDASSMFESSLLAGLESPSLMHVDPTVASPFSTFRRNSTHMALTESAMYLRKIAELQQALTAAEQRALEQEKGHQKSPPPGAGRRGQATPATPQLEPSAESMLWERNQTLVKEVRFADQTCVELSGQKMILEWEVHWLKDQLQQLRLDHRRLEEARLQSERALAAAQAEKQSERPPELVHTQGRRRGSPAMSSPPSQEPSQMSDQLEWSPPMESSREILHRKEMEISSLREQLAAWESQCHTCLSCGRQADEHDGHKALLQEELAQAKTEIVRLQEENANQRTRFATMIQSTVRNSLDMSEQLEMKFTETADALNGRLRQASASISYLNDAVVFEDDDSQQISDSEPPHDESTSHQPQTPNYADATLNISPPLNQSAILERMEEARNRPQALAASPFDEAPTDHGVTTTPSPVGISRFSMPDISQVTWSSPFSQGAGRSSAGQLRGAPLDSQTTIPEHGDGLLQKAETMASDQQRRVVQLEGVISVLKADIECSDSQLLKVQSENVGLRENLAAAEEENARLSENCKVQEKESEEAHLTLRSQMEIERKKIDDLRKELTVVEADRDATKSEFTGLRALQIELEAEVSDLRMRLESSSLKVQTAEASMKQLQTDNATLRATIYNLEEEKLGLATSLATKSGEFQTVQNELRRMHEEIAGEYSRENVRLSDALTESKKNMQELEIAYVKCNETLAECVSRSQKAEAALENCKEALEASESLAADAEERFLQSQGQLEQLRRAHRKQQADTFAQLEAAKRRLDDLRQQEAALEEATKTKVSLSNELQECLSRLEVLSNENESLRVDVTKLTTERDQSLHQLSYEKNNLDDCMRALSAKEKKLGGKNLEISALKEERDELLSKQKRLKEYARKLLRKCDEWEVFNERQAVAFSNLKGERNRNRQELFEFSKLYQQFNQMHSEERALWLAEKNNMQQAQAALERDIALLARELSGDLFSSETTAET